MPLKGWWQAKASEVPTNTCCDDDGVRSQNTKHEVVMSE